MNTYIKPPTNEPHLENDKCKIYLRNLTCGKCKGECPADKMEDLWYVDCFKYYK
jgi:hypothetical protein